MNRSMRLAHEVAIVVIGVSSLVSPVLAQDCAELIGRWPYGPTQSVAVSGGYAYFGSGAAILIADISKPSAPKVVGRVALPEFPTFVAVDSGYAYVADGSSGLRVIDVRTPSAPVEVGFVDTPGSAEGVAVGGRWAYVADRDAGLRVIDVRTPSAPVEVGFVDTPGQAWGVAVEGGYAYVGDHSGGGLRVIDVRTPSAPVEAGFVDTPGAAWTVAVAGGYAYVADWGAGVRVIDVRTPSAPVQVASFGAAAIGVAVAGGNLYVADYWGTLMVIDVSTPSAPVEVARLYLPGTLYHLAVGGGYAYVASYFGGLRVIDVSRPSAPVEVGFADTPGEALGITVAGNYAYVGESVGGLRVVDVSTPSAPVEMGFVNTPGYGADVAVAGDYAYVANNDAGLRVIDVSTPSVPAEVGFVDTPGHANGVAVAGQYAYVADSESGLRVVDVSTPSAPVEVGFFDTPGSASAVAVGGGYAYVADNDAGLRVIDVRTPSAPAGVGFVDTPGHAVDVVVEGQTAYVADKEGGLRVVDVSRPSAPAEKGFAATPSAALSVAVAGDYAYVGDQPGNLRVIDVSVPSAPVEVRAVNTPGRGDRVAVADGYVFFTTSGNGLFIFRECGAPDGRVSFIPAAAVAEGAEGAFFQTDLEINNRSASGDATVTFGWLPRGTNNSQYATAGPITLGPGESRRYENVLTGLFGLAPDSVGALQLVASTTSVLAMSRTYNVPAGEAAGTFGQGLPGIRATAMIAGTERRRIVFLSEDPDSRANVGCVNGSADAVTINIAVYDQTGARLDLRTMDLGPYANNQVNRILRAWQPVRGAVEVWSDSDKALFYCYGSMVANETSDPTTILPQAPASTIIFIPAAALAEGLEGAFFQTDVDLFNTASAAVAYHFLWLPRGADNRVPARSGNFSLGAGKGVRYANVLGEVFRFQPDQVGALAIEPSGPGLVAMSRTYNLPASEGAGTFGQGVPGIAADRMTPAGVKQRIMFMDENDGARANVGCQNGSQETAQVLIQLFDADGESLETRTMYLKPLSNQQVNRVFRDHSPISAGYVDVWTTTPGATIYCYGSVADNLTNDPTTVLPQ